MKNPITTKLIKAITKEVKPTPSKTKLAFLADYYHRISGQDYTKEKTKFFSDAAEQHYKLAKKRKPNEILLTADNISLEDGSRRTLISLVMDDLPFIVNTLSINLNRLNKRVERTIHPLFQVTRSKAHTIKSLQRYRSGDIATKRTDDTITESFIQFEIEPVAKQEHPTLIKALYKSLQHITTVTNDWQYMREATLSLAEKVERNRLSPSFAEYGALFRWMTENHFAFVGYGEVEITPGKQPQVITETLSGILRAHHQDGNDLLNILPPLIENKNSPVTFTKSQQRVYIHRANYLDCILIDHDLDNQKKKTKKRRVSVILGFLAGSTATLPIASIPHLRSKSAFILSESSLRKGSYAYKELRDVIETLPREMIFQLGSKALYGLCMTLLNHKERRKTRLHINRNICGHFFSCLVYVPRDLFNSRLRQRILDYLKDALNAHEVTFNVHFSESILTRIHYTGYSSADSEPKVKAKQLEADVQSMARDWNENLLITAQAKHNLEQASELINQWRDGFPTSYQENFELNNALEDIQYFGSLESDQIIPRLEVSTDEDGNAKSAHFKLYSKDHTLPLSDVLPILENMGIRAQGEHPYKITRSDNQKFWINDFEIIRRDNAPFNPDNKVIFEDTFQSAWDGKSENDGFNQLTHLDDFDWRKIAMLRGYYRYLKQIRLRYSENYIIETLVQNPTFVTLAGRLFESRFNPAEQKNASKAKKHLKKIEKLLQDVATLDEERILRALIDVMQATLRTNYYQTTNEGFKDYLSFKLNSKIIPRIPEPAPKYEIFVYSPRVEGVHLRGGDVARGGLRWSERPEDFRTEVLGLVKAQRVKNAVIVPVGSKGGFVAKHLPQSGREQIQQEVIACYRIFISALLDVTDNLINNKIVPPKNVVRFDGDDPYLVVAADKGTATFSDIANEISENYDFWLDDAFASGGSVGYDHKKMGITARGAWESVKRHFRALDKDIQTTDFTAVGIGDMGGDVFGNGMLLSKHIRLVAAFNHMHIFIDPNPTAKTSHAERERLFNLPRSSWTDYNAKLISKGGGIYERSAKSIKLTPEAKQALSADRDSYTPDELINVILKSEAELLWNGGIGTYIKASFETDQDAQDRNNDSVRVSANELRAKVIGEGGNLGMTQYARIEFNKLGGHCYTDAIDNSAGVDTSDHEVNIKILLGSAIASGDLTQKARNPLLAKMEQEIADLVLANNYMQTQVISYEAAYGKTFMPQQMKSLDILEHQGLLNREIEFLPDNSTLRSRQESGQWLTPAELSVLLSYSKMNFYQHLLDSNVPDDAYLEKEALQYFPAILAKKYPKHIGKHRLKREIISTQITNDLIGKLGSNFHLQISELLNVEPAEVGRAYIITRDLLGLDSLQQTISELDNKVSVSVQNTLLHNIMLTTRSTVEWLLRNRPTPLNIGQTVKTFGQGILQYSEALEKLPKGLTNDQTSGLQQALKKSELAPAKLKPLLQILDYQNACDIINISLTHKQPITLITTLYFSIASKFGLDWTHQSVATLAADNDWNQRAQFSLAETLRNVHTQLVTSVLKASSQKDAEKKITAWELSQAAQVKTLTQMSHQLKQETQIDFAMLSVFISELSRLINK